MLDSDIFIRRFGTLFWIQYFRKINIFEGMKKKWIFYCVFFFWGGGGHYEIGLFWWVIYIRLRAF